MNHECVQRNIMIVVLHIQRIPLSYEIINSMLASSYATSALKENSELYQDIILYLIESAKHILCPDIEYQTNHSDGNSQ